MSDLARRVPTAIAYGAIVLGAVLASREVFLIVLGVIAALALLELFRLRSAGIAAALQLVVLGTGVVALVFLRDLASPPFVPLLATILAVWAADVAAYLVGSAIGRHRIAPRISPGKTWEGTIAGSIAAAAVIVIAGAPSGVQAWWIVTAALIGPAAFAGDLLESWVKRRAGVKDSGRVLPGHGGVLDRIDSLVAAAPLVAGAILLLGRVG